MDTSKTPPEKALDAKGEEFDGAKPSIATHRPNRFELVSIRVKANGIEVHCVERGVHGSAPPPLELKEGDHLLPHHVAYAIEALGELERLFEARYAEHETANAKEHMHAAIKAKLDAEAAHAATRAAHDKTLGDLAAAQAAAAKAQQDAQDAEATRAALEAEHARLRLILEQRRVAFAKECSAALAEIEKLRAEAAPKKKGKDKP